MQQCLLQIIDMVGKSGYYSRSEKDRELLNALLDLGFIKTKKGTKNIYLITDTGHEYIERLLHGRDSEISKDEFYSTIKNAYSELTTSMNPALKIPVLRKKVVNEARISNELFDKSLVFLHDEGTLTLQTSMTANEGKGGIYAKDKNYYYVVMDEC